ncbi:histone chaperone ASF1-like [Aricia agestis]|uniref:histone chaperone ASF1-like n=1 Tax=Aricia agestis TaxID=91739 RepID=UPI001C20C073|nr:histone chaperone ASF1-like [Aricia agestis]
MKQEAGFKYISSCRLCLANNRRTIDILHTPLQPLYEKLISSSIHDETPMCFLCHKRLQQCHQFVKLIKDTQGLRENYIKNGYMMDTKPPKPVVQLAVHSVMNFGIPFEAIDNIETIVKEEAQVKEEPQSEDELEGNDVEDSEEEPEGEEEEEEEEENGEEESSEAEDDVPVKAMKRKQTTKTETPAKNKKAKN